MCKRVAQFGTPAELTEALQWPGRVCQRAAIQPQADIAPLDAMGLLHAQNECLVLDQVRWGWCPRWANVKTPQANAPVDKITHSPYWKPIWRHRALCPVNGWFEWRDDGEGARRLCYIRRRDGRASLIAAAGQFPHDGREVHAEDGFVLLVAQQRGGLVDARALRPVVLPAEQAREWLDTTTDKRRAEEIIQRGGEPDDAFEWFALAHDVEAQADPSIGSLDSLGR